MISPSVANCLCANCNIYFQVPSSASMALGHSYQVLVFYQILQTDQCVVSYQRSQHEAEDALYKYIMRILEDVKPNGITLTDCVGKTQPDLQQPYLWSFWWHLSGFSQSCNLLNTTEHQVSQPREELGWWGSAGSMLIMMKCYRQSRIQCLTSSVFSIQSSIQESWCSQIQLVSKQVFIFRRYLCCLWAIMDRTCTCLFTTLFFPHVNKIAFHWKAC